MATVVHRIQMYIEEQTGPNFSQDLLAIEGKKIQQIHQK